MRSFFTLFLVSIVALSSFALAREKKVINDKVSTKNMVKAPDAMHKVRPVQPEPAESPLTAAPAPGSNNTITSPISIMRSGAGSTYHAIIDSSRNGYGWLNPSIRTIDRFEGVDAAGNDADFLLLSYRQYIEGDEATGIIGASQIDVASGLENGTLYVGQNVNAGYEGTGGRYPGVNALDWPFISFNNYVSGDGQTTPTLSHPYQVTDYSAPIDGYGPSSFDWTHPDWLMDDGWVHPEVSENRLWNAPTVVVKDDEGFYRFCGIYATWFSEFEKQTQGRDNDHTVLTAATQTPDWYMIYGWDEGHIPTEFDPANVRMYQPAIDMNKNGFGAIASAGYLGYIEPDSAFYDTMQIVYTTTVDTGVTWAAPDTIRFETLGIPAYVYEEDSTITYWEVKGEDTVLTAYEGPTEVYLHTDMDVLVTDNEDIYIAMNIMWGRPSGAHGIIVEGDQYSGQWVVVKEAGSDEWRGTHIHALNGSAEGDYYFEGIFLYWWGSEIDLGMDENGYLYAGWLDRPPKNISSVDIPKYSNPNDPEPPDPEYVLDIYMARSWNKGVTWTDTVNVTSTTNYDEYEFNMSKHLDSRNDATIWFAYSLCSFENSDPNNVDYDTQIETKNYVTVGEATGIFPPSAIEDKADIVARDYALEQNYPNPFNPSTRIEFVATKSGKAVMDVYNTAGQKVAEVFNANVTSGNSYMVDFDGSNLAAGVYFYRLKIEDRSEVKKMVLVK